MKIAQMNNRQTNFGNHGIIAREGAVHEACRNVPGFVNVVVTDSFKLKRKGVNEYLWFDSQVAAVAKKAWDVLIASGHAVEHIFDPDLPWVKTKAAPLTMEELVAEGV